jgi:hypothetical protein
MSKSCPLWKMEGVVFNRAFFGTLFFIFDKKTNAAIDSLSSQLYEREEVQGSRNVVDFKPCL